MQELRHSLSQLSRPRLLLRAARHGIPDYCRERDLARLLRQENPPQDSSAAINLLLEVEQREETTRRSGALHYSLSRHIDLLIALMAEMRRMGQNQTQL